MSYVFSYQKRDFQCNFKGNEKLWFQFKEMCVKQGVSICAVMELLMQGWIEGQKVLSTTIQPVHMNITMQHIVKRPRRLQVLIPEIMNPIGCKGLRHENWLPSYVGWCRTVKKWIHLEDCACCPKRR